MVTKDRLKSLIAALLPLTLIGLMTMSGAHSQVSKRTSLSQSGQAAIKVTAPSARQTWEKGNKYPIRWESRGVPGEVRILLVRQDMPASQVTKEPNTAQSAKQAKPIVVAGNTANSGSYDYVVPGDIPDGLYKAQVMTVDGSVKGTSEGTVAVGSKKPEPGKTQVPGAATSTGQPPSAGATASKASPKTTTPSVAVAGKSQAAAVKVVKVQVNPVKISEAELKNLPPFKAAATGSNLRFGGHSTPGRKIVVTSPKDGDVWEADKEYTITWESTGITGDVKIDVAANQYQMHPITARTVNSGAYLFRVPRNFVGDYRVWRARVSTLDGTIYGWSPPSFTLYTQDVDLQCLIYDPRFGWNESWIKSQEEEWLQFNVRFRNDGIRFPLSIDNVLVQIIKEPEEVICYQEEWGVSRIYPHEWYQLPEPRKFRISSRGIEGRTETVNLNAGAYRAEVWLDPQNHLGELEGLRQDNKAVMKWIIK